MATLSYPACGSTGHGIVFIVAYTYVMLCYRRTLDDQQYTIITQKRTIQEQQYTVTRPIC